MILLDYTGWAIHRVPLSCVSKNWNQGIRLGETKCHSCRVANHVSDLSLHGLICMLVKYIHPASYLFTSKKLWRSKKNFKVHISIPRRRYTHIHTHLAIFKNWPMCTSTKNYLIHTIYSSIRLSTRSSRNIVYRTWLPNTGDVLVCTKPYGHARRIVRQFWMKRGKYVFTWMKSAVH